MNAQQRGGERISARCATKHQIKKVRVVSKMTNFVFLFGKIIPQPHNILLNPPETLAKNTKKTKTPNARKKMLRPPVESRF